MDNNLTISDRELEQRLGYVFRRDEFLALALTHSSWANEHGRENQHNQRLEFLGDAVLEFCVSAELYNRFPDAREGPLTEMRASLVSEPSLARLAREMGLDRALRLGNGEERQNGRNKDSLLADAFEAVLAAVYMDGGMAAAQDVVGKVLAEYWPTGAHNPKERDPKSQLQEFCQKNFKLAPTYTLLGSSGPEHAKSFEVNLRLPDGSLFFGRESSCKKAEQAAAVAALRHLGLREAS